jgi:hypothetical protein
MFSPSNLPSWSAGDKASCWKISEVSNIKNMHYGDEDVIKAENHQHDQ